jgi:hypothetical protein
MSFSVLRRTGNKHSFAESLTARQKTALTDEELGRARAGYCDYRRGPPSGQSRSLTLLLLLLLLLCFALLCFALASRPKRPLCKCAAVSFIHCSLGNLSFRPMNLEETLAEILGDSREPFHLTTLKARLRRSTGHFYSGARVYAALQALAADGRVEQLDTFYFRSTPSDRLLLSPPPSSPTQKPDNYSLIHREFCGMLQEACKAFEASPSFRNLLQILKIEKYALNVGRALDAFKNSDADVTGKTAMARVQAAFSSAGKPLSSSEEQMDQAIAYLEAQHRQQLQKLEAEHQLQLAKLQKEIQILSQERATRSV